MHGESPIHHPEGLKTRLRRRYWTVRLCYKKERLPSLATLKFTHPPYVHLTCRMSNIRFSIQPIELSGRGERIRTSDPLLPKQVRYQAALRPDIFQMAAGEDSSPPDPSYNPPTADPPSTFWKVAREEKPGTGEPGRPPP